MYTILIFTLAIVILLYLLSKRNLSYWKNRDVPFSEYHLLFGNIWDALIVKKSLGQVFTDLYNDYKDFRYIGFYKLQSPGLIIRDPEIVKSVLMQNFDSFSSNGVSIDEKVDPLASRNAFVLNGHKWKSTRSLMTRCFTAGKMKTITPLLEETGEKMVNHIEKDIENIGHATLDVKELMSKFTLDNVSTCAFGLIGDSFVNPDSEFLRYGKKIFEVSTFNAIKILCVFMFPSLASILKMAFIPKDVAEYLIGIVNQTLKFRKENNVIRKDFLHYMEEIQRVPSELEFNNVDITAQCASFFLDGYESSSITLTFALYLIAKHPDVQNKLKEEIDTVLEKHGGQITYDGVKQMTYMDQVLLESQRFYPISMFISKTCTKEFTLPPPKYNGNGKEVTVEIGTPVILPFYGIQHDERHYANPEQFDPERFSEENKHSIDKGSLLSFSSGPRMCLGQPFAILQVKMGILSIVKNFEIRVNKKTNEPLEIDPKYFMLSMKGAIWIDFNKREN